MLAVVAVVVVVDVVVVVAVAVAVAVAAAAVEVCYLTCCYLLVSGDDGGDGVDVDLTAVDAVVVAVACDLLRVVPFCDVCCTVCVMC